MVSAVLPHRRLASFVVLAVACAVAAPQAAEPASDLRGAAVLAPSGELVYVPAQQIKATDTAVARVAYVDAAFTASNFGKLRIVADNETLPASLRYRAAGFLEGWATAERIWQHFVNTRSYFETQLYPGVDIWGAPMDWLARQEDWVQQQLRRQRYQGPERSSASAGSIPDLWESVALVDAQLEGLVEGYAARHQQHSSQQASGAAQAGGLSLGPMERRHHMFLQNNGELYDIVDAWLAGMWGNYSQPDSDAAASLTVLTDSAPRWQQVRSSIPTDSRASSSSQEPAAASPAVDTGERPSLGPRWQGSRTAGAWLSAVGVAERCSALVKVTGDLGDLLVGHATWDSFTQVLRIYKHYDFGSPGHGRLSFSSYPGEIFSDDDFYISASGLVVTETTNHIFDPQVYASLTPESLLSWQRVRAALLHAASGQDWVRVFSSHNSGTYNNQYMVVDMKLFQPHRPLQPGLLWIAEQLPGMVFAADMTEVLARGHFASYNVPYNVQVYNASGYPAVLAAMQRDAAAAAAAAATAGEAAAAELRQAQLAYELPVKWLEYQVSPRAEIFRRDQGSAGTLDGMKALMRYNAYATDPYSNGHPLAAICGRQDLPAAPTSPFADRPRASQLHNLHATKQQSQAGKAAGMAAAEVGGSGSMFGNTGRHVALPGIQRNASAERPHVDAWRHRRLSQAGDDLRLPAHPVLASKQERAQASKIERLPKGCYDGKVTSFKLAMHGMQAEVVGGPTTSHGLPPFRWSDWPEGYSHLGQPDTFNFDWELQAAEQLPL